MTDQPGAPFDPRAFLRSRAGGALTALAGVLLIVALLIAVGGEPADERPTAAGGSQTSGPASPSDTAGTASQAPSGTNPPSAPATTTAQPPPGTTTAAPPETTAPATSAPPSAEPPHVVRMPISVLNNTTVHGLADTVADQFRDGGWQVAFVGNFAGRIPVSTVYYTPGHDAEQRAAEALAVQFPAIQRVMPRYEGLPAGVRGVVVVVVRDWVDP